MIKISASTNPENEDNLINYVKDLEKTNIDFMHCDVMDGQFVKNKCLSSNLLFEVSQNSSIALDVHLMVENPIQLLENYLKCRPTILTVHYESFQNKNNLLYALDTIKKQGILAGISINPSTPINEIKPYLPMCNLVLIMSVVPGVSGQKFIEDSLKKINELKSYFILNKIKAIIEVDGGINAENIVQIAKNGADIVVMGNAIYKAENKKDYIKKVKELTE